MTWIAVARDTSDHLCGQQARVDFEMLDRWAYENGVTLDFSRPGEPTDNALMELSNGRLRDECLNTHWFLSLVEAGL